MGEKRLIIVDKVDTNGGVHPILGTWYDVWTDSLRPTYTFNDYVYIVSPKPIRPGFLFVENIHGWGSGYYKASDEQLPEQLP